MLCPRCRNNTTLWIQKISQDKKGTAGEVTEDGRKVFICEPCKSDWISLSTLFKHYWKKVTRKVITDGDFDFLFGLYLNNRFENAIDRKKFSQVSVAIVIGGELSKRAALHIPDADLITSEDYAWAAGLIDALGKITDHENPGKICLIIRHEAKHLLDRLKDIIGGNVTQVEPKVWSFTTTKKNSEAAIKRLEPYFRCSKGNHPTEISEDDRTLSWITGFAQAAGKGGVITHSCKWAIRLMSTIFPGIETASGEEYSFAPEEAMRKRLMPFIQRKLDPEGTLKKDPRKAEAFLYPAGARDAQGVPRGSRAPFPSGPKPNSKLGPTPRVEDLRPASEAKPTHPSVWDVPSPPPDPTPEIEVSGDTQVRLSLKAEGCIVCQGIYRDLEKDKGFLKGSKEISLLGKLNHLYSELDAEISAECPECKESVPLRKWSEDFSVCGFCGGRPEGEKELADDKKWASV